MKRITVIFLSLFIAMYGCSPQDKIDDPDKTEQEEGGSGETGGDKDNEDKPDKPEPPSGGDDSGQTTVVVVDPGEKYTETKPVPQYPDLEHEVSYAEFVNPVQDYLDSFGNVDYVCAQGNGTAWPLITDDGHIRFYQGSASKGGGYLRVRAHNGAKLLSVTVGSATSTKLAYSIDGKARKSETSAVDAGGKYVVEKECGEVCFYCMGTAQSERWELNYIMIRYRGGFVEADRYVEPKEYGPLVRVAFPFTENFDDGFPTTDKPSYYKYGITAGRENLQWSTWFGSFSWQKPISGGQSVQLRVYQEDEEYDQTQFGYLKTEYFVEGLSKVSFSYKMSVNWIIANISYCEFGSNKWQNPQQIALTYSEWKNDETIHKFTYELGRKVNAKIRIEIDPASGYPSKGHNDFYMDDFVFE